MIGSRWQAFTDTELVELWAGLCATYNATEPARTLMRDLAAEAEQRGVSRL